MATWPTPVSAATMVRTGGGASGVWSDPANWSLGRVPTAGDEVEFSGNPAWSSVGRSTFSALRAEGANVLGATGGELIFRNNAFTASTSTITVTGGTAFGAAGGQASFQDSVQVEGNVNILAGTGDGLGGRATFRGRQRRPRLPSSMRPAQPTTRAVASTIFSDNASAGNAFISNNVELVAVARPRGLHRVPRRRRLSRSQQWRLCLPDH